MLATLWRWIQDYLKALKAGAQEPIPMWEIPVLLLLAVIDITIGLGLLRLIFIAALVINLLHQLLRRVHQKKGR